MELSKIIEMTRDEKILFIFANLFINLRNIIQKCITAEFSIYNNVKNALLYILHHLDMDVLLDKLDKIAHITDIEGIVHTIVNEYLYKQHSAKYHSKIEFLILERTEYSPHPIYLAPFFVSVGLYKKASNIIDAINTFAYSISESSNFLDILKEYENKMQKLTNTPSSKEQSAKRKKADEKFIKELTNSQKKNKIEKKEGIDPRANRKIGEVEIVANIGPTRKRAIDATYSFISSKMPPFVFIPENELIPDRKRRKKTDESKLNKRQSALGATTTHILAIDTEIAGRILLSITGK